jgi:hypothetical protein
MSEEEFLLAFERGRITSSVLYRKIKEYIRHHNLNIQPDLLFKLMTEKPPVRQEPDARILQFINDTAYQCPGYYKEAVQIAHNQNIDELIQPVLFRFLSAFFDFGLAYWPMPDREKGLWRRFCEIYSETNFFSAKFLKTLKTFVAEVKHLPHDEATSFLIHRLSIPDEYLDDYMFHTLYRHKGWVGTIKSLETTPEWIQNHDIKASYKEAVSIILVLELAAIEFICEPQSLKIPVYTPKPAYNPYFVAALVSALGIRHDGAFPREVTQFTCENLQEIWQRAYEDTLYIQFLSTYRKGAIEARPNTSIRIIRYSPALTSGRNLSAAIWSKLTLAPRH